MNEQEFHDRLYEIVEHIVLVERNRKEEVSAGIYRKDMGSTARMVQAVHRIERLAKEFYEK